MKISVRYFAIARCHFYYADMLLEAITGEPEAGLSESIKYAFDKKPAEIKNRRRFATELTTMLKMYQNDTTSLFSDDSYDEWDRENIRFALDRIDATINNIKLFSTIES